MKPSVHFIKRKIIAFLLDVSQIRFIIQKNKVECNNCHFKANKFKNDQWHEHSVCPYCKSEVRHRLLIAALSFVEKVNYKNLITGKKILHFAPEPSLYKLIKKKSGSYKTSDFEAQPSKEIQPDYLLDISDMHSIGNNSFDCVIACDVLEHVPEHLKAMQEVYRILNPGGSCIFTVPQKDHLKTTFEDNSITDAKEREKVFGQFDHLRIYGDDFTSMLEKTGFHVTAVDENIFDKELVERLVLCPPVLSKHPLATNYRKIFFGRK